MTEETKEVQVKNVNADLEKAKLEFKMEMIKLRADYAKAFNLFEQQVKAPSKNGHVDFTSKKGRTKYDYVTIDDLINSINHGIKGTGLSWQQEAKVETQGQSSSISVRTIVRHENGYEYVSPWVTFVSSIAPNSSSIVIPKASAIFFNSNTLTDCQASVLLSHLEIVTLCTPTDELMESIQQAEKARELRLAAKSAHDRVIASMQVKAADKVIDKATGEVVSNIYHLEISTTDQKNGKLKKLFR